MKALKDKAMDKIKKVDLLNDKNKKEKKDKQGIKGIFIFFYIKIVNNLFICNSKA